MIEANKYLIKQLLCSDFIINAIVTSLDDENLLATPMQPTDLESLLGKKIQYVDKNEKAWPGVVKAIEDPFIVVKFDVFPSGIGQGQIIEVLDEE